MCGCIRILPFLVAYQERGATHMSLQSCGLRESSGFDIQRAVWGCAEASLPTDILQLFLTRRLQDLSVKCSLNSHPCWSTLHWHKSKTKPRNQTTDPVLNRQRLWPQQSKAFSLDKSTERNNKDLNDKRRAKTKNERKSVSWGTSVVRLGMKRHQGGTGTHFLSEHRILTSYLLVLSDFSVFSLENLHVRKGSTLNMTSG